MAAAKLNLSEFTDTTFIKIYSISVDIVVVITLLLMPLYYYIILKKSLSSMKFYQKFLLIYTTYTLFTILSYAFFKQGFIVPLSTTFSISKITNLPKWIQLFCFIISHTAGGISTDFLLIALFQRYFYVSKAFCNHKKIYKYFFYSFIIFTCIFANVWYQFNEIKCLLPENELMAFFVEKLENASEFLLTRNNFVIVYGCNRNPYSSLGIFVTFSWISRPILLIGIGYKNIEFAKRFSFHMTSNTAKMHKMLLKAVLTQILCCIFCSRVPMLFYLFISVINIPSLLKYDPYIDSFAVCILPLLDMLVTVYFISPYRKFVLKIFQRKRYRSNSSILPLKPISLPSFHFS